MACQAITWTNAGLLLITPWGTNFSEILIGILAFSFKKMHLKASSAKRRPFCLALNVLNLEKSSGTHQGQNEMAKILHTTFCIFFHMFSSNKIFLFLLKFIF